MIKSARAWLVADADLHGFQPSDIRDAATDFGGDEQGFGAVVVEHRRVLFWAPVTRPGYEGFPSVIGSLEISIGVRSDGAPTDMRMGLGGDNQDSRHLPADLALTIGTAPKLAASDPRAVANVIGQPLKVYRSSQHDIIPIGVVSAADITALVPTLEIKKEETGVRLTIA